MVHIVTYDLRSPNDTPADYDRVITAIKGAFPNWAHVEKSVWLVDTPLTAAQVRDHLQQSLHDGDVLFVARLHKHWASIYFGDERNNWLKTRAF